MLTNHQGLVGGSAHLLEQKLNKVISQLHSHSVTVTFLTSKRKICQCILQLNIRYVTVTESSKEENCGHKSECKTSMNFEMCVL